MLEPGSKDFSSRQPVETHTEMWSPFAGSIADDAAPHLLVRFLNSYHNPVHDLKQILGCASSSHFVSRLLRFDCFVRACYSA